MLEGLDASILSLSQVPDLNLGCRLDAEFFSKRALLALDGIRERANEPLGSLCKRIQHPTEVKREYEDHGLLTVMAKDVRSNRVDLADPSFMPGELRQTVTRNRLNKGDILVTRTGANYGQAAPWKESIEAFACADILVIREPKIPSGYLSSFLESEIGKPLVLRGGYGAGQPHIAPSYLANLPIPRFDWLEKEVDDTVEQSGLLERNASDLLRAAELTLLEALGLANWAGPEPLTYTAISGSVREASRLDSQFFAPRIQALLDQLSGDGRVMSDVARPRRDRFLSWDCDAFNYIEIGDVDEYGSAESTLIPACDAPSRATWHVRAGDVITSSVRPIRRLTAMIKLEQDGFVCSSGFVVMEPREIPPEVLLTYLRLPVICELLDLYASASMYPAIKEADIFSLPLPILPNRVIDEVVAQVGSARLARARSAQLLQAAKRSIKTAIENGETVALRELRETEGV